MGTHRASEVGSQELTNSINRHSLLSAVLCQALRFTGLFSLALRTSTLLLFLGWKLEAQRGYVT